MHDVQHADRIADSVSLTLAVHIVLLVCKNQLRFVSSMTLMTLNPEVRRNPKYSPTGKTVAIRKNARLKVSEGKMEK